MIVDVISGNPLQYESQVLALGCFEDDRSALLIPELNEVLGGLIERLYIQGEFTGGLNKTTFIHSLGNLPSERILLVGLGQKDALTCDRLRQVAGTVVQLARAKGITEVASMIHLQAGTMEEGVAATIEGAMLANYSFNRYRTKKKGENPIERFSIFAPGPDHVPLYEKAVTETRIISEAVLFARDMVSQPSNVVTPPFLAEEGIEMADVFGLGCRIIEQEEMEQLGMDALLAVSRGSRQPPKLIVLEHLPNRGERPVVLVGKGVTFDSGGISLKPRDGMEMMKTDMAGAAAVMATLRTVAALRLPLNVVGIIPAVENLPGGSAYKPGDVLCSMSGQTIEIVNTDAEGRLILCDAMWYARRYEPRAIIDIATLTGACTVALGTVATGLLGNDMDLKHLLSQAGEATGERVWELPLWEEYGELMKSDIADMKNAGGATAGTISAGWFLLQFVGDTSWAHLDIAGTAWEEKGRAYVPKGASGVGVRLLVEYLRSRC
ncbi:leucyl aminopeptidase [Geobacter sp. DSM 9736]|uniref:leucyl aminopeptidase n=1 Tax=Geobacter sp. DSM 9736 TaxID=1277350 RepID=UPI000B504FB6|nr:leucyl aminopeptidase [Geobacter sp. DSM 9736]SNB47582.1 leucyl aminopeptidase [Geobacter sp. DSM 9736]